MSEFPVPDLLPVKVVDKRGVGHVPAEHTLEPEAHPPTDAAPPLPVGVLETIDFLRKGDQFWVRDVKYVVVEEHAQLGGIFCRPVELGRTTMRQMRKAGRKQ